MRKTLRPPRKRWRPATKDLLAMDENNPTCNKRFAKLGIPQTEQARRAYRELIVTTAGIGESIRGSNSLRRDDPPADERPHALYQIHRRCGKHPRASKWTWVQKTWQVIREKR